VVAVAIALFTISWPTPHVSAAVVNAVDVGGALNVVAGPDALWLTLPDSHGNSAITRVDPTSGLVRPSPFQGYPDALVLSESGTFVTDLGRSRVVEIDENSGRELASLALPPRPDEVTVGAGSLWVSSIQAGVVSRVELSLAHVVSTIRVGHAPYFLVFASGWAWAGNHDDRTLSRIDPATNQVAATIPLGARPWRAAASNTGLWVTSRDDGVVLRVDPTGRITARVRVSRPDGVAAADDGSVWVATDGGRLVRIDGRTAQVRANVRVSAGSRSTSVAVAEDGSVWVTDVGRGLLLKVDPTRVPG
jgi:YVTN family beta-propeller protein